MRVHELIDWTKLGVTARDMGKANDLIEAAILVDKPDPLTPMYRIVLDEAGYFHTPATEQVVRDCFADYVDAGHWSNLDSDDIEDFSTEEICVAFLGRHYRSVRRAIIQ
jgi:hypothetical protein